MATAKTTALTFRIEPNLKDALRTAAANDHRFITNMIEVMIREHCARVGIAIAEWGNLSRVSKITQGTVTAAVKRDLQAQASADVAAHKDSDAFKNWQQATNDDYNERIAALREALEDDFLAKVKTQVDDYPIFMAIAEDIGYDATGRPTTQNELETVARELARFLENIEQGELRPFV